VRAAGTSDLALHGCYGDPPPLPGEPEFPPEYLNHKPLARYKSADAMTDTNSSMARFTAVPIAPDELSMCSSAGETFSKNSTAPSAARTESVRRTLLISDTASCTR